MKNKKGLSIIAIAGALIAAFAMSFLSPIMKRGSSSFAGIADYLVDGYNGAEFLHNATKLSGNSDRPASITFMHHGLNGSYDSLSGIAKYLAESNDVDIYFARIDKPTYVYYEEGDISPSDPGDPRFRNLTVYNETLRAVVDHDAEGRVIYNDRITYDETTWKDKTENGIKMYASRLGELAEFKVKLIRFNDPTDLKYDEEKEGDNITEVDTIVNPSKHSIILFNSNDNKGSHAYIYNEFNAIVDRLSYDIFLATGAVPRVNLVSHSMGGVITMMYMTEHPYNVANYISIDSPHNFINAVSVIEAILLPFINRINLPGFNYKSFSIPQNEVYAIALLAEMFLPILTAIGVVDAELAENLQEPNMFLAFKNMVENIFSGNYGNSLEDMAEAAGLPTPTPDDVYTVLGIIGEAFGLPDLEGILTYDAEKCAFVVNFDAVISALLSNGEIAELLKTLSNGTINITPDNVTPEAIDAWLSQIGSEGRNAFWLALEWEIVERFVGDNLGSGGAVQNFMNPYTYEKRKADWNALFESGAEAPNVNALAIGASARIDFLFPEYEETINSFYENVFGSFFGFFCDISLETLTGGTFKEGWLSAVGATIAELNGAEDISSAAAQQKLEEYRNERASIIAKIQGKEATDETVEELSARYYRLDAEESFMRMNSELRNWFRLEGDYIYIEDDIFIDLDSTLAVGYEGFSRYNKIFTADDRNMDYAMDDGKTVLSVHGAVLDCIETKLQVFWNLSPMVGASSSDIFETQNAENGIIITGLLENENPENLAIPSEIDGRRVIGISDGAFANQSNLKTVIVMPESLSIGKCAFLNCASLESIEFYNGGNIIKNITVTENVEAGGESGNAAIKAVTTFMTMTIPDGVQIGAGAFSGCYAIKKFAASDANQYHTVVDGVLYDKQKTELIAYPSGSESASLNVPESVTKLGDFSIQNAAALTDVTLNNVKIVGADVFKGCENIATVSADRLEYIENAWLRDTEWFINSTSDYVVLGKVLIDYSGNESVVYLDEYCGIGSEAFSDAANLTVVYIAAIDFVVKAGENVLEGSGVQKIYIPKIYEQEYRANLNWNPYSGVFDIKNVNVGLDLGYGGISDSVVLQYGWFFDVGAPAREGFDFNYWYDDTGKRYTAGETWSVFADAAVLYAEWTPNVYTLCYDAGDSLTMLQGNRVIYGKTIGESLNLTINQMIQYMPRPVHYDNNFEFSHWSDIPEGENVYDESTEYLIADDLTLYAVFVRVGYNVTYSLGYASPITVTYETDEEFAFITVERSGYRFGGWYDDAGYAVTASEPDVTGETVYYAKWDYLYTIYFNANGGSACSPISGTLAEIPFIVMPVSTRGGYKGSWGVIGFKTAGYNYPAAIPESVTLTAAWEVKSFAESYNSSTDRYEIYFASQLAGVTGFYGIKVQMMQDISLSGYSNWTPIQNFSGIFDGGGFTISDLKINKSVSGAVNSNEYYGLFAWNSGTIRNFKMTNVNIYYSSTNHSGSGMVYVGAVAGYQTDGHIQNITVTGNIECHRQQSAGGGIVGRVTGQIYACAANVQIVGNGDMGGIAGYASNALIYSCTVNNSILSLYVAYTNRSAGGIVGCAANNTVILVCDAVNTIVEFIGYGGLAGENLTPSMGIIVGHLSNSSLYMNTMSGSYIDTGSLTDSFKYGLFNLLKHNQKRDVGNGPNQCYGNTSGDYSIYY